MLLRRFLTILICLTPVGVRGQAANFVPTGSMNIQRTGHTATLLTNGLVLVTGGEMSSRNPTNTAELYDSIQGSWRFTRFPMNAARAGHTATLLPDGTVLIAGGFDASGNLASVEIFDPQTEQFTTVSSLRVARRNHQAVLLNNGKVLAMGGYDGPLSSFSTTATAELFDPNTRTWSPAASMPIGVVFFAAARLLDGKVLVTGGESNASFGLTNVSLYDPSLDTWRVMAPLLTGRQSHTATTLAGGKVLIVAGNNRFVANNAVEIYEPSILPNGQASPAAAIPGARVVHQSVLLGNGRVLVIGGQTELGFVLSAELFDPTTGSWADAGSLNSGRAGNTATLLPSAGVLVAGGVADVRTGTPATNSAEVWSPAASSFDFVGHAQTWVVPNNVTSVTVDARGAQGGGNAAEPSAMGGKGGRVQTTLAVTPGETLFIYVGGRGGDLAGPNTAGPGGFNGGGAGGIDNVDFNAPAGGGGGASDVRQGGDGLANRVVVAGGGGGAECCVVDSGGVGGAGGGLTGMSGGSNAVSAAPGGGGTQTSGGLGGAGCNGSGSSGSLGQGGVGGNGNRAGGGGGGGIFGGGGGGGGGGGCLFGSGGGGGSSYSAGTNTIHTQGHQTGDGQVIITATGPAPVTHTLTVASTNPASGVAITVSPSDNNNLNDGATELTRTYNAGVTVTLVAPANAGTPVPVLAAASTLDGNIFSSWTGCDTTSGATCTLTMNSDRTATANYVTPGPPAPSITSILPTAAVQAKIISDFEIDGANFKDGATVSFNPSDGITVGTLSVSPPSKIVTTLIIDPSAATGPRAVTVTNPDTQPSNATTFVVIPLGALPAPTGLKAIVGNQTAWLWWDSYPFVDVRFEVKLIGPGFSGEPFSCPLQGLTVHTQREFCRIDSALVRAPLFNGIPYQFSIRGIVGTVHSDFSANVTALPGQLSQAPPKDNPVLFLHGFLGDGSRDGSWKETIHFLETSLSWNYGGELYHIGDELNTTHVDQSGHCFSPPTTGCVDQGKVDATADFFTATFGNSTADYTGQPGPGIAHQGGEVHQFVKKLNEDFTGIGRHLVPLTLVGHSNGGLAGRDYLSVFSDAPSQVANLITYGTPHSGADLSNPPAEFGPLLHDGARDVQYVCTSSNDVSFPQTNAFLLVLDTLPLPEQVNYTVIAGVSAQNFPLPNVRKADCFSADWDGLVPRNSADLSKSHSTSRLKTPVRRITTNHTHIGQGNDFPAILCALDSNCAEFQVASPVDIEVTAPSGRKMAKDFSAISGASYMNILKDDGHEGATVLIPFPEGEQYTVKVIPKPDAQPTDTFTITLTQNGVTTTIADRMRIQDIPAEGFHPHVNSRPFANAGADQTVECTGPNGTPVTLDGSASGDSDGDALIYVWTDAQGNAVGNGAVVEVLAAMGTQTYTLTVTDPSGFSATAQTHVTVQDTTPPTVTASLVAAGEVEEDEGVFRVVLNCSDKCDAGPKSVANINGVPVTNGQVVELELEDEEQEVKLDDGRLKIEAPSFLLTVTCTDASGNSATATAKPPFATEEREKRKRKHKDSERH